MSFHYALATISSSPTSSEQISKDEIHQIIDQILRDWYGLAGPVGGNEVGVIETRQEEEDEDGKRVVLRFASSATSHVLTALAISSTTINSINYRIQIEASSKWIGRLGRGGEGGMEEFRKGLRAS